MNKSEMQEVIKELNELNTRLVEENDTLLERVEIAEDEVKDLTVELEEAKAQTPAKVAVSNPSMPPIPSVSLAICNLVSQGMSVKEAQARVEG